MHQDSQKSRPNVKSSHQRAPVFLLLGTMSSQLLAMPSYNASSQLHTLRADLLLNDPLLNSAEIFGDHIDPQTLYVSPANRKVQTGVFRLETAPACEILANQYALTYMVPSVPASEWSQAALKGPVSGYFDFSFGNYLRNHRIINELAIKIGEIEEMRAQNPEIISEYESALSDYEFKLQERDKAQFEYDKFATRIKELTQVLIAAGSDTQLMEAYRSEIVATREEFSSSAPRLIRAIAEATSTLNLASSRLAAAKGSYSKAVPNEALLLNRIAVLSTLFDSLQSSSKRVFDDNNRILVTLETSGVGRAAASYSIWGDEVARLKSVAEQSNAHYNVWKLPIYDVRVAPTQSSQVPSTVDSSQQLSPILNNAASMTLVNQTSSPLATGAESNSSSFSRNGRPIQTRIAILGNEGAMSFDNVVTRGAYCTGSSQRNVERSTVSDANSMDSNYFSLQRGVYKPRVEPVLSQSVALSYTYNLKNQPVDISCEMDIQKFSRWTSQKNSSGFLFWRLKKSGEERRWIQENGLVCSHIKNDFGPGGSERAQEILDQMTQEIAAEFILQYAKSYEILGYKEVDLPNPGVAASKLGTAMGVLCGANVYCQVGSIVLKTGNELFGYTKGSASGIESISGKISRNYREHAYTSLPGSAVIDLTVTLE